VTGQLPGRRYPGSAAQIEDPAPGPQQAGPAPRPSRRTGDVLGPRRLAVIAAVSQGDGVVAAPDQRPLAALPGVDQCVVFAHQVEDPASDKGSNGPL